MMACMVDATVMVLIQKPAGFQFLLQLSCSLILQVDARVKQQDTCHDHRHSD